MSVPHTGKLTARLTVPDPKGTFNRDYLFNGDVWHPVGPPDQDWVLTIELNALTAQIPKHHRDIKEIAQSVFRAAGLTAQILSVEYDTWLDDLPDDAID